MTEAEEQLVRNIVESLRVRRLYLRLYYTDVPQQKNTIRPFPKNLEMYGEVRIVPQKAVDKVLENFDIVYEYFLKYHPLPERKTPEKVLAGDPSIQVLLFGRTGTILNDGTGVTLTGGIGTTGPTGPAGPAGVTGATGPQGEPGEKGTIGYFATSITSVPGGETLKIIGGSESTVTLLTDDDDQPYFEIDEKGWRRGGDPVTVTVGGVDAGDVFSTGTSARSILEAILYPYVGEEILTFDNGLNSTYEVGQTVSGTKNASWTTAGPDTNWVEGGFEYSADNGIGTLATGLDYDSKPDSYTHPSTSFSTPTTVTYTITGEQNQGSPSSATDTTWWYYAFYAGKTLDPAWDGTGFNGSNTLYGQTKTLRSSPLTWSFTVQEISNHYTYIIIPTDSLPAGGSSAIEFVNSADDSDVAVVRPPTTFSYTNTYGVSVNYTMFRSFFDFGGQITIKCRAATT